MHPQCLLLQVGACAQSGAARSLHLCPHLPAHCCWSIESHVHTACLLVQGLFNFKPSVRPVPLECHIQGYPGKFYCPRMATMNKPAYAAIQTHSPLKPVLVFVSSRRQVS